MAASLIEFDFLTIASSGTMGLMALLRTNGIAGVLAGGRSVAHDVVTPYRCRGDRWSWKGQEQPLLVESLSSSLARFRRRVSGYTRV